MISITAVTGIPINRHMLFLQAQKDRKVLSSSSFRLISRAIFQMMPGSIWIRPMPFFGSPTYMAMAPWQFKKFADASSKRWAERVWQNKLAVGFTNSAMINGDKAMTVAWLSHFAMQHGMLWVGLGVLPSNTLAAQRNDIN